MDKVIAAYSSPSVVGLLCKLLTVWGVLALSMIWPFYAFDTTGRWPGILGNLGILLLALFATWRLWPFSQTTALMIAPVAVWITIATAAMLDGASRYGW